MMENLGILFKSFSGLFIKCKHLCKVMEFLLLVKVLVFVLYICVVFCIYVTFCVFFIYTNSQKFWDACVKCFLFFSKTFDLKVYASMSEISSVDKKNILQSN